MDQKLLRDLLDKKMEEYEKIPVSDRSFLYDGVLYPTLVCSLESLKALPTFRARGDDVILVGYPKTGTSWVGQMLTQLEVASGKYDEDEQKQRLQSLIEQFVPFLEFEVSGKFEHLENLPSRRIIKTHLLPQKLPKSIFEKKAKILVLLRNPKDTAVSFFHFCKGIKQISDQETWDEFFEDFILGKLIYGSYFDHIIAWNQYLDDSNIFCITYEELKENTALGLKKVAEFLDFSVTEEEIESIVKKTSFESMKDNSETYGKMGEILFRKGIIGDWMSVFSESQNEKMDRKFEASVAKTKLGMMLNYELYCKN